MTKFFMELSYQNYSLLFIYRLKDGEYEESC